MSRCEFVPPHLLREIARSTALGAAGCCQETLVVDEVFRDLRRTEELRSGFSVHPETEASATAQDSARAWQVHDAEHGTRLPGREVRGSGDPATSDVAVDEAAAGIEATLRLFAEEFGRKSYDGKGAPVSLSVHYRENYDNAFWDGQQLVFGDGDAEIFERFTKPVDVLAHEFGHAVIDGSARLVYADQSGALNESVADVFACCLLQWLAGQEATEGSWLIGEGLFLPGVQARALRDLAAPGTAYDGPVLGKDPQVDHMNDFVTTEEDHGGVHLNSGIPNKAFHLAAIGLGGKIWERAGQVWYAALVGGRIRPRSNFEDFATETLAAAERLFGSQAREVVSDAWAAVGVPGTDAPPEGEVGQQGQWPESGRVCVRRAGGFAGITRSFVLELGELPAEVRTGELAGLLDSVQRTRGGPDDAVPDAFQYTFEVPGQRPLRVPEKQMTGELHRLMDLVQELGSET